MTPELGRTRLAWSLATCRRIMGADSVLDWTEVEWLSSRFPTSTLEKHGLADAAGKLTPAFDAALLGAAERLRDELPMDEKLSLVALFHAACVADGVLEIGEYQAMHEAARALGLSEDEISAHLDQGTPGAVPPRRDTLRRRR